MSQVTTAKALVKSLCSLCSKLKLPTYWGRWINHVMSTHNGFYIQPVICQLFHSLNYSRFLRKSAKFKNLLRKDLLYGTYVVLIIKKPLSVTDSKCGKGDWWVAEGGYITVVLGMPSGLVQVLDGDPRVLSRRAEVLT